MSSRLKNAGILACLASMSLAAFGGDALQDGFRNPPPSARPHVWWMWMNGNVAKDGITGDLEAMARAGIGGATVIDVSHGIPEGSVVFASDEWFSMLRHANGEAKRLGIELTLANGSGWSSSGGPWVTPEDSMKHVVFGEKILKGGERLDAAVPAPQDTHGFYRDIATVAFPRPAAESVDPADYGMKSSFRPGDCEAMMTFEKPFPLTGVALGFDTTGGYLESAVTVEVSEDGKEFRKAADALTVYTVRFSVKDDAVFVPLPEPAEVRAVRVTCDSSVATGIPGPVWEGVKSVRPDDAKGLASPAQKLVAVRPEARARIPQLKAKMFEMRARILNTPYRVDASIAIDPAKVAVLKDGGAGWTAPEGGDWIVVRFGYAANGMINHPATKAGKGLEVDKLSKAAVGRFFAGYAGKAFDMFGPVSGKGGFRAVHVDSYEVGGQNWTRGFDAAFRESRGYDIVPYLPVLTGRVVGSAETTEKFLNDFRHVISDLFVENYAGEFERQCHRRGLLFSVEGYGSCPCNELRYAARCDVPMGEFWAGRAEDAMRPFRPGRMGNCLFPGFIAHVWGKRVAGAEAFTSLAERWDMDPSMYKAQGDRAYCQGVNRIVYHRFAHQPWATPGNWPGMTMGNIGSHIDRTQTWWDNAGAAWFRYQARCQWMLQEGETAADVLVFSGDSPSGFGLDLSRWHDYGLVGENAFGTGRQWDVCDGEAIRATRAKDGKAVVPGGVKYAAVAVLPGIEIAPESQKSLDALAAAGVPVVPAAEVHETLLGREIGPDVVCLTKDASKEFRWIHRRSGAADWYFVALHNIDPVSFELSFRDAGRIPEIWNPETGEVADARKWRVSKGRTVVTLDFDPSGAAFVVFRKKTRNSGSSRSSGVSRTSRLLEIPWRVEFPVGWYFGNDDSKDVAMTNLADWTSFDDPDIKYFSGTATYRATIPAVATPDSGTRVFLDFGEVKNVAEVSVNGKPMLVLWKPPFRIDVTDAMRNAGGKGVLDVAVKVTNLWPNRLIGDDAMPCDAKYNMPTRRWKGGGLKGVPARVKDGKPSPTGRHTFTTWRHWKKEDGLLPSGLLGPVMIETESGEK